MARLTYQASASLDGYVADRGGKWDWSRPDEEVHAAINDMFRPTGTELLGRRMYEVLVAWETMDTDGEPEVIKDFAEIWRGMEKIVYSRTLESPSSANTRIEREFDPEAVRRLKEEVDRDLSIAGPELAAQAFKAGLIDDVHMFLSPVIVGGGNPALPSDVFLKLELVDQRRFASGVAHLHYRPA